jgi:hypothetical protein
MYISDYKNFGLWDFFGKLNYFKISIIITTYEDENAQVC